MRLFRRRDETLNEILLREAGFDASGNETHVEPAAAAAAAPPPPPTPKAMLTTVDAPAVGGREVSFVALPDGSLLVETEEGDGDLAPMADAVERQLDPPYRARATRLAGGRWSVTAEAITVVELHAEGDSAEVPTNGGSAHAERLDGDYWEIRASAL